MVPSPPRGDFDIRALFMFSPVSGAETLTKPSHIDSLYPLLSREASNAIVFVIP